MLSSFLHITPIETIRILKNAGLGVTPAEGVPGLYDVHGVAYDVTFNQLIDIARIYKCETNNVR